MSIKTCRRPALTLPDGKVVGKLKSYYRVGEKVKFACNVDANETHVITCTSEGSWTHLSYACGGEFSQINLTLPLQLIVRVGRKLLRN